MRGTTGQSIRTTGAVFFFLLLFLMPGCIKSSPVIRVGVVDGPEVVIMQFVKEKAQQENLTVELVVCKDYAEPNALLAKGRIDANSFQPQFFLEQQKREHGYFFSVIGKTVFFPLGIYADGAASLQTLPLPAKVLVPQDTENRKRALKLLQASGYPQRPWGEDGPPALLWETVPAGQMNEQKHTAQAFVMQPVFAKEAGYTGNTSLLLETPSPEYSHVLVAREGDEAKELLKHLVRIYQSEDVRNFIREHFEDSVLPAW